MSSIQLSDHFTYRKLLLFVLPSIGVMIFTSIYGVVDGYCVSQFVGKTAFSAVNLVMPFPMLMGAFGFMLGTGGSAIVSKTMGEGDLPRAGKYFSMLVFSGIVLGLLLTLLGEAILPGVVTLMKADEAMRPYCILYGRILLAGIPFFMLQYMFQSFMVTAEKPTLGFVITLASGLTNILLDIVLVGVLRLGVAAAAAATVASQVVGGLIPLLYFIAGNSSPLRLRFTRLEPRILGKACANGCSELLTNISMSLVNILYNYQLMAIAGADGVAAYGVIMYVCFIFIAVFVGYVVGSAPIVGYHYGAGNHSELQNMVKKSLILISISGIVMTALGILCAAPLSELYVGYDEALCAMTTRGFRLYSLSFLIVGFNIFGSAFFTALGNGLISGIISFLRTLVFQIIAILVLPQIFGLDGIWCAVIAAEGAAILVTAGFLVANRRKYHYGRST